MIRMLRFVLLGLLAIMLLTVALANRSAVTLRALPDDLAAFAGLGWQLELPLYAVIFASILAGVLIGFVWEWFREHKHRAEASTKSREVSKLERELAVMRDTKPEQQDDILALLDQRKVG
ncbi:MAG: LapA family protein [Pseudotabrizicola sp.]|uniref:LapA family protein n=1 Tax=Pseudotabrizicola sp. TaxID=2939647 RepID=UPI0027237AC6|nr:LapA family protein [Pseudotabrizicola sp.]MDO8883045.1 LapA family protein [Pseudotabrizicola sp.]MDP2080686.1 LapA family protein [Pseudotabrizicola sp.]MDZ7574728.1 LapA family protein [Pseudotabrizicola sp.]